ncbi:MAG: M15 family metallopeptidase [Synergistales bacterium]|nr:M15 family metallopeptidase [Synergistales bacterium]
MRQIDQWNDPIPQGSDINWRGVRGIPIEEEGESLHVVGHRPDRVVSCPQYFLQGLPGALPAVFLRREVLIRLARAAERLPDGYRFVVFDGWRSASLQETLFSCCLSELRRAHPQESEEALNEWAVAYVARPSVDERAPSPHLTGGAVDLTIADERGLELDMGTAFDATVSESTTSYYEDAFAGGRELSVRELQCLRNRRLLYWVMVEAGFSNFTGEWWHYDYGNQSWAWTRGERAAFYGATAPELRWWKGGESG